MPTSQSTSILARIVAAHNGAGPGQLGLVAGLETGLTRAIRRAALPYAALAARVSDVTVSTHATLTDAVEVLPDHGILAALEDEDGRRGLVALAHPLVDALIEVQTTGHVEEVDLPPRPTTRIDESLCRDFLDLVFGSFAQETGAIVGRDWPDRVHYGSMVADRAQLNLLLPERGYHLLKAKITAADRKSGDLVMLIPTDPVLARRHAATVDKSAKKPPVVWGERILKALSPAPMVLDAVLMRVVMPLGEVEALSEGDLVPFDRADLGRVQLESDDGHVVARGALGQAGGKRAFRLTDPSAAAKPHAASPAPAIDAAAGLAASLSAMAPPEPPEPGELPPLGGPPALSPADGFGDMDAAPAQGLPDLAPMPQAPAFDPNAPMGEGAPHAALGGFDPDSPLGAFDPDAPMG